jgi:hypothetical protein
LSKNINPFVITFLLLSSAYKKWTVSFSILLQIKLYFILNVLVSILNSNMWKQSLNIHLFFYDECSHYYFYYWLAAYYLVTLINLSGLIHPLLFRTLIIFNCWSYGLKYFKTGADSKPIKLKLQVNRYLMELLLLYLSLALKLAAPTLLLILLVF